MLRGGVILRSLKRLQNSCRRMLCLILAGCIVAGSCVTSFAAEGDFEDTEVGDSVAQESPPPAGDVEVPSYDGDDNASINGSSSGSGTGGESGSGTDDPIGDKEVGGTGALGTDKTPAYYTNQYTQGKSVNNEPNWDAGKFVGAYNDPDIYGVTGNALQIGLQKVDYGDMSSIRAASDKGTTAPDAELAAQRSGDIINVAAGEQLYGMKAIVDQLSVKQITVRDWNTIMWGFVVSQFATPYSDSLLDVLEHPLFKQMIEQDLKINSIASTLNEGVHMDDVFIPDKVVVQSVAFSDIAENMKKHLKYNCLYSDIECTKQVQLWDFLTSPEGTVYYVADRRSTLAGVSLEEMWKNRGDIYMKYSADDIESKEVAVPVYIQSNVSLIYNQINIGSFLHGQSNENDTSSATFAAIVGGTQGATGAMGGNNMYIDSFGNICVHHDGKFKIVLCSAQNSIFNNIEEPKHVFDMPETNKELPDAQANGIPPATVQSNESMNLYNKPFITCYSRHVSAANWDADREVYFTGDSVLADFPGYVQYKRGVQNSHRNQVVMYKMPVIRGMSGGGFFQGGAANYPLAYGMPDDPKLNGDVQPKRLTKGESTDEDEDSDNPEDYKKFVLSTITTAKNWWTKMTTGNGFVWNSCSGDKYAAKANSYSSLYAFVMAHVDEGKFPYAYNNITKSLYKRKTGALMNDDVWALTNVMMTFGMGCSKDYRIPQRFYQGDSKLNGDGEWVDMTTEVDATRGQTEIDNFTFGVTLVDTLDYGQNWSLISDGSGDDPGVQNEWTLPGSGLFKSRYKITTTLRKQCYKELESILIEKGLTTTEAASHDKDVKKWLQNHSMHAFVDNCYMFLRDTRITDRWVDYGIDDIALVGYTWLNYYLPNTNLFSREIFRTGYEDPFVKKFRDISLMTAEGLDENGNPTSEAVQNGTYSIVKGQKYGTDIYGSPYGDDGLLYGPYKELHGSETECDYDLYPDTAPAPACVPVPGKTGTYDNHLTYNAFDLMMALYCNTNADKNKVSDQPQTAEVPVVDKNEILEGIWRFFNYPVSTAVSWLSGILQSIHRSVSSGTFGEFFSVSWITTTDLWKTVFQYYFIVLAAVVLVISIYQFIQYLLRRDYGISKLFKRFVASFALVLVPITLINYLVMGMDSWGNTMIDTCIMKAAVAETGATVAGKANANRLFEYNYQMFREQFNSIEDTVGQYTYKLPQSFYPNLGTYKYKTQKLQDSIWAVAFTSNQGKTKWYDYRGFVPVNKERYQQDLYFYFYDYIKWQFLQYCAVTSKDSSSIKLQDRAREFRYGTTYDGDLNRVREQCLDDDIIGVTDGVQGYISAQETLLMQSKGDYAIMMNDPIYIYGESFETQNLNRWEEYALQDLFGLGYLLTDKYGASTQWEPSDELYKYPGWQTIQTDISLKKVTASNGTVYFQNQGPVIQDLDEQAIKKGLSPRQEQVFASKTALFNQTNFIKAIHKSVPMSPLEKKLISLNQKIYKDIQEMVTFFPGTTPNDAFISLAALKCSFEFTRAFGNPSFLQARLEPIGFTNGTVSFDSALKGIYAKSVEDLLNGQELMYIILDNSGGFGLLTCVLIIVLDIMAFVVIVTRNVLIIAIFVFAVYLCVVNYVVKKDYRNKTILGMGFQILGLFLSHTLTCKGMALVAKYTGSSQSMWFLANPGKTYGNSNTSLWMDIFTALLLILIFFADMVVHVMLAYIIFKDFNNFGGNIVANKMKGAFSGFKGVFNKSSGKMSKYEKAAYKQLKKEQHARDGLFGQRRAGRGVKRIAAGAVGVGAAAVAAAAFTKSQASRLYGKGKAAAANIGNSRIVKGGLNQLSKLSKFIPGSSDPTSSKKYAQMGASTGVYGTDNRLDTPGAIANPGSFQSAASKLQAVQSSNREKLRAKRVTAKAEGKDIKKGGGGSGRGSGGSGKGASGSSGAAGVSAATLAASAPGTHSSKMSGRQASRPAVKSAGGSGTGSGGSSGGSGGSSGGASGGVTGSKGSTPGIHSTTGGTRTTRTPSKNGSNGGSGTGTGGKPIGSRVAGIKRVSASTKAVIAGTAGVGAAAAITAARSKKSASAASAPKPKAGSKLPSNVKLYGASGSSSKPTSKANSAATAGKLSSEERDRARQVLSKRGKDPSQVRHTPGSTQNTVGARQSNGTSAGGNQNVSAPSRNAQVQVAQSAPQPSKANVAAQQGSQQAPQQSAVQQQYFIAAQQERARQREESQRAQQSEIQRTKDAKKQQAAQSAQSLKDQRERLVREKEDHAQAYRHATAEYEAAKEESRRQKDAKYRLGITPDAKSKADPRMEEHLAKAREEFSAAERASMNLSKIDKEIATLENLANGN